MVSNPRIAVQRKWRIVVLQLLLFVLLLASIRAWQQRDMGSGTAPPLHGSQLDGNDYALPVKPDRPMLVHFWATWCPTCRIEQNSIASIARDWPDSISIAMQSGDPHAVTHYLREHGLSFPVVNDPDNILSRAWGVHAVPASFILDRNGNIRFIEVGYTTELGLRLRLWLAGIIWP